MEAVDTRGVYIREREVYVFLLIMLSEQANHHSMVGSTKDPADGKAVAGSVFAAVIVYAVSFPPNH